MLLADWLQIAAVNTLAILMQLGARVLLSIACAYTRKQAIDIVDCRKDMLDFMLKAANVTDDIMTCFAIGLGLPEDFYREARCTWLYCP